MLPQLWGLGVFQAAYQKCNWTLFHVQESLYLEQLPKTRLGTIIEDNLRKVLEGERRVWEHIYCGFSSFSSEMCDRLY